MPGSASESPGERSLGCLLASRRYPRDTSLGIRAMVSKLRPPSPRCSAHPAVAPRLVHRQMHESCGSPVVVVKTSEHGLGDDGLCDVDGDRRLPRDPLADSLMGSCLVEVLLVLGFIFRILDWFGSGQLP